MKNINKLFLVLFSLAVFVGCDENADPEIYTGDNFVAYNPTSASLNVAENGAPITLEVTMTEAQSSDVTVNLSLSYPNGNVALGEDFEMSSSAITIPAGQYSGSVTVTPIDNSFFDGEDAREIVVTIDSNSAGYQIGLSEIGSYAKSIILVDDDCPIDLASFIGKYTVEEVFTSGTNEGLTLANAFGEAYQVEFAAVPGDITGTKVAITNSPGFNTYLNDGTVMTFNTCEKTVTFDDGDPQVALFRTMVIESTSYDESAFSVQADGPLGTFGPYQFIFTKQ